MIKKNRPDGYGGVAIALKKQIQFKSITFSSNLDIIVAKTVNLSPNFVICAVYFPPSLHLNDFTTEVKRLFQFLNGFKNVLICGDFNARSTVWGDSINSPRGKKLVEIVNSSDFWCLNNSCFTFKRDLNRIDGSVLDLTFTNAPSSCTWNLLPFQLGGSHHFPILIEFSKVSINNPKFLAKKKLLKALGDISFDPSFEIIENKFQEEISAATFNWSEKCKPKAWWNEGLAKSYRLLVAAFKKAKHYPSPENLELALERKKVWQAEVKKAKKENFEEKIAELNYNSNTREAWNFVKCLRGINGYSADSKWNSDNNGVYLKHLKSQVPPNSTAWQELPNTTPISRLVFQYDELVTVLNAKKRRSAGGCDGITYDMIRALSDNSLCNLLTALNDAFLANNIRESWRCIKIVPIPKKDKDLTDFKNFRPISLISVMLKLINQMLKLRLTDALDGSSALPRNSFAYRKDRSAAMCINQLHHEIAIWKNRGLKVILLTLDIENAYNCVRVNLLVDILRKKGIEEHYTSWIANFLSNRILKIGTDSVVVNDGLPQGSCLSPMLFNVYTAKLHDIQDDCTSIYQFADDFIIASHHRDFDLAEANLHSKVRDFNLAANTLNLTFNLEKCNLMYIAQGNRKTLNNNFDNVMIKQTKSIKFLGRVISSSLTLGTHYDQIIKDSSFNLNFFKMLTSVRAGLHPQTAMKFYRSFIRSKIEYCRTTTGHANKTVIRKITTFQNCFLRRSLGVPPATPVPLLYAVAYELPPTERSLWLTSKEILKLKQTNSSTYKMIENSAEVKSSYSFVFKKFKEIFVNTNVNSMTVSCENLVVIDDSLSRAKSKFSNEEIKAIFAEKIDKLKRDGVDLLATDASVVLNAVGCGIFNVTNNTEHLFKIEMRTSSTFGELWALLKALDIAKECKMSKICIFTDSLSSCLLLKKASSNNCCVTLFKQKVNEYGFDSVRVIWSPGHAGIPINERADAIAKKAVCCGSILSVEFTFEEALRIIRNLIFRDWYDGFRSFSEEKPNLFAKLHDCLPTKPWFYKSSFDVKIIKMLNRILVGCTYDSVYLYKIGANNTDLCVCGQINSYVHKIFNCPLLDHIRTNYSFFNSHTDLVSIFKNNEVFKSFISFLNAANLSF